MRLSNRLLKLASLILPFLNGINSDCISNPTDSSCTNYVYSNENIEADMINLCRNMPYMPGCSIRSLCGNSTQLQQEAYCDSFSILADVCKSDMPGMGGCKNYVSLCKQGSLVPQCKDKLPISNLPNTETVNKQVKSICNEMTMDGCEKCATTSFYANCDLLGVYSQLCQAMPEMDQCSDWKKMCPGSVDGKAQNNLPYCEMNGEGNAAPQMRMYFHTGFADYVLFKEWVPRTAGQYAGTFIAIVVFGVIYELLLTIRSKFEVTWTEESIDKLNSYSRRQFTIDTYRAIFQFFESSIAYLLMLVSMTFNVGLFFAVILGITLGTLIFSRFRSYGSTKRPCGC
ncbi:Ctr-domain-containing protein [Neoconidiobolus thromboides FSU 785]|nr:Ctr-domain-containing protein [Neoconidiobolus thromboides FSU 785]